MLASSAQTTSISTLVVGKALGPPNPARNVALRAAAGRIALPSSQGIIACCSERGRNNPRMFVLICNSYDSSLQNYVAIVRRR